MDYEKEINEIEYHNEDVWSMNRAEKAKFRVLLIIAKVLIEILAVLKSR